ncbi:MAG: PHP domain-containing protein [Oscillospiraceae bacterium]|nr:PHP domain-containing protein [Oscillospiraceae bacterium]
MEYLIELHCHSSETSACSAVSGARLTGIYKQKNYHAITIMDHYYKHFFERLGDIPWEEKIDIFLTGYKNAKTRGDELGITVILGMEIRFNENSNDYLVFGLDENFLYNYPELYNYGAAEFSKFAKTHGLLLVQAHPFRDWMTVINHDYLDGIEIYNAHPWHNSRNNLAQLAYDEQQKKRPFIAAAGSDCHELNHEGRAGIISDTLPKNSAELAALLKSGKYRLYIV